MTSRPIGLVFISLSIVMNSFFLLPAVLPELGVIGQDKGSEMGFLTVASQKAEAEVSPPKRRGVRPIHLRGLFTSTKQQGLTGPSAFRIPMKWPREVE